MANFNTNVLIEFQSPKRAVETYVLVLQQFRPGVSGVQPGSAGLRNMASTRYLDRFEKCNGECAPKQAQRIAGNPDGPDFR